MNARHRTNDDEFLNWQPDDPGWNPDDDPAVDWAQGTRGDDNEPGPAPSPTAPRQALTVIRGGAA